MFEELRLEPLVKRIQQSFGEFCDIRRGANTQYDRVDAGMGAFSGFFTQSPSFLAYQEDMKPGTGKSNAESLFGMDLLIAMDGTEYFSSKKIQCGHCSGRELNKGKLNYYPAVLTPVIVQSGNGPVIALEPEYITAQDGKEKQDCEIEAGKRGLDKNGDFYAKQSVTRLGDDLYSSRQPFVQVLKGKKLHFILEGKPDSHLAWYEMVDFLAVNGVLAAYQKRYWNGK